MKPLSPEQWHALFGGMPESGMGYFTADVSLRDGREIRDVCFCDGSIAEVRGLADIPFKAQEIVKVALTHRRWVWNQNSRSTWPVWARKAAS